MCLLFFLNSFVYSWNELKNYEDLTIDYETDLIVWDLDHTLIEPLHYEGSEPWFQNLLKNSREGNVAFEHVIALYCASQKNITLRLTDPQLPSRWEDWMSHHVPMLGLTSRSYELAKHTCDHLEKLSVPFTEHVFDHELFPDLAYKGIVFTSGGAKKDFLKAILKAHPQYRQKRIIFIDDTLHHIESMEKWLQEEGLEYKAYLYTPSREKFEKARTMP